MVLDSENQRKLLIGAINATNWPGQLVEEVAMLKVAIATASIASLSGKDTNPSPIEKSA